MYSSKILVSTIGVDEWGDVGTVVPRFSENADCQDAYRNYMCWMNFPRCDDAGRSLIMCRSACENYFKSCMVSFQFSFDLTCLLEVTQLFNLQQHKDLWRCGDPKYVNGYAAEVSTTLLVGHE